MLIEIINLRNSKPQFPWDVKVDRSSVLGNPFLDTLPNNSKILDRDKVCNRYKEWFYKHHTLPNTHANNELLRIIKIYKEHGKLRLFCWCAPKRCHAETIKEYILNQI